MRRDTLNQAANYHRARSCKSKRNKLITVLAAIVVFCTTYALIMPAITLTTPQERLDCPLSIHEHTDDCYDSEGNLICGEADFVVHTHDGNCYDAENNLVCELPEIEEHEHDESCYYEARSLICDLEESEGHQHTGDCYIQEQELICTDEDPEHEHTDDCYEWTEVLICGEEESGAGHIHTDECYEITRELICGEPAIVLHEHTDDCYDMGGNLICGQLEVLEHKHSAECFVPVEEDEEEPIIGEIIEEIEEELIEEIVTMPIDTVSDIMNAVAEIDENDESGANGEGESTEPEETISHNLGDYITGVTLQKRPNEWSSWEDLTTDETGAYVVDINDQLQFTVKYKIELQEGVQLGNDSTFTYTLPDHLKPVADSTGNAVNAMGDIVGQYQISTDGTICIDFNEHYIELLAEGITVDGFINFMGSVSQEITSQPGSTELEFTDEVKINVTIDNKGMESNDLQVYKWYSNLNAEAGTVAYTITVWSEHGTPGEVTLHDVMTNIGLDGEITVQKNYWISLEEEEYTINKTSNGFDMNLPRMEEGGTYIITYTAKLSDEQLKSIETVTATNDVTVRSQNEQGVDLESSAHVETHFTKITISKTGVLTDDDTIQWTITINNGGRDIAGYRLEDIFNGEGITSSDIIGDITINGEVIESFQFPYSFPVNSTADSYTIVYCTKKDALIGSHQAKNKATLEKDDEKFDTGDIGVDVTTGERFEPLTKTADSLTVNEDGKTATIRWTIEVDASMQAISANWTLNDQFWSDTYITQVQYSAMVEQVKEKLEEAHLSETDYTIQPTKYWEGGEIIGFTITCAKPLAEGIKFSFTFESTANLGDGTKPLTFTNHSDLNGIVQSNASIQYTPVVRKYDLYNGKNYNDSTHEYSALEKTEDGKHVLTWGITVTPPKNYTEGDLIVTETLPKGTELTYLNIKADKLQGIGILANPTVGSCNLGGYSITANQNGQIITITLPGGMIQNSELEEITFTVKAAITNTESWEQNEKHTDNFQNSVTVTTASDKTLGSDQQTQTITKDETIPVVTKNGAFNTADNILSYSIVVNPEGKDLLPGEESLTLVDTLSYYRYGNTDLTVSYVFNSLHVYDYSNGEKGEALGLDKISYLYETQTKYNEFQNILTIHIPDGQALLVEYQYQVSGTQGMESYIDNVAALGGCTSEGGESQTRTSAMIQQVQVGADARHVTINKCDKDNFGLTLAEAQFQVYQYNSDKREYVPVTDGNGDPKVYTTGENGQVSMDITYNTAYKVVEVKAPNGYIKTDKVYEFYVASSDVNQFPEKIPKDFTGEVFLNMGAELWFLNEKDTTTITVKKQWFNTDGQDITTNQSGSITFDLYQMREDQAISLSGSTVTLQCVATYDLNNPTNLAPSQTVPIGSTVTISFADSYCKEISLSVSGRLIPQPDYKMVPVLNEWGNGIIANRYSYTLTVSENTVITVQSDAPAGIKDGSITIDSLPSSSLSNGTLAGTKIGDSHTISNENNWTQSISGLARFYKDDNGNLHSYRYYVVETSSSVQTTATEYENNLGIVSGTITIKNTIDETPSYVLPETGGTGTTLYTAGGLLLMGGAISLLLYHHAKGKKEDSAPA